MMQLLTAVIIFLLMFAAASFGLGYGRKEMMDKMMTLEMYVQSKRPTMYLDPSNAIIKICNVDGICFEQPNPDRRPKLISFDGVDDSIGE
jgi:hypothetical protein